MIMDRDSIEGHASTDTGREAREAARESQSATRARLRILMDVASISQRDMASRSGVPQATLSRFLSGSAVSLMHLERIRTALEHQAEGPPGGRGGEIGAEGIRWACRHVAAMRDTDMLPRPPEYALLARSAPDILAALGAIDIAAHQARAPRRFLAPKLGGGFRAVTQLEPVDTLLYAALVHQLAPVVEAGRAPVTQVFSFRANPDPVDGHLWRADLGWREFVEVSGTLSTEFDRTHVLVADISDCYGQIAPDSVREALEDLGITAERANCVSRLLLSIAGPRGRGLPVGPHPSALLAEAVLGRVDEHLKREGRPWVRYVDDIRIFCSSLRDARRAWLALASFVTERLGLGLNDTKTRILTRSEFQDGKAEADYGEMIDVRAFDQAGDLAASIQDEQADNASQHIHSGHALRSALLLPGARGLRRARTVLARAEAGELDRLLDDATLTRLVPVLRSLCLYLLKPFRERTRGSLARRLLYLAQTSEWADIPFVRLWIAEVLATRFAPELQGELDGLLTRSSLRGVGLGPAAILAVTRNDREWVRQQDREWESLPSWDQRAVISAARILTDAERERWAQRAEHHGSRDPLLVALAHDLRRGDSDG